MLTTTKKYFFVVLLLCVLSNSKAQNYFDSLATHLKTVPQKEQIEIIKAIPFDKMNSNTAAAVKLYKQAINLSSDKSALAYLNEQLAIAYYYKGDYDLSVQTSLQAIKHYEQLNNHLKEGSVYASLGYQMKRRNLPKAFDYMRKGIYLLEQINDQKALSAAYNNFGVLHEMDNDMDSALFYYQKGLVIVEQLNDSIGIPYSLNNIATAYVILKKVQRSFTLLPKSI